MRMTVERIESYIETILMRLQHSLKNCSHNTNITSIR
jgi:hypothetical protein